MKSKLRKEILSLRDNLTLENKSNLSRQIWMSLVTLPEYLEAKNIMTYLNFRSEVETIPFLSYLFADSKNVYSSITNPLNKILTIYPVPPILSKLEEGPYGILQPPKTEVSISPQLLDLVIVPGTVFDLNCQRIGYGAGYYDRFLPSLNPKVTIIGLAYELQLVDRIQTDKYDCPMDIVITEKRIIRQKSYSG